MLWSIVWDLSSQRNLLRVLVLQKAAARVLAEIGFHDSSQDVLRMLKIHTVANLFIGEEEMLFDRKGFPQLAENHSYNTRNNSNYSLNKHCLTSYKRKPSYIGTKVFKKLPQVLKQQADSKQLKDNFMEWLVKEEFYSIKDFLERGYNQKKALL